MTTESTIYDWCERERDLVEVKIWEHCDETVFGLESVLWQSLEDRLHGGQTLVADMVYVATTRYFE